MATDSIDLQGYFPFFLGTISNRWTTTSSRFYLDSFGIGIGEWRVLASVRSLGSASSQEIVNLISMDASAVSRSIGKLEKDDFVKPIKGKFAGRTKPFSLTAKGAKLYTAISDAALSREQMLLADLSAEERTELLRLMRKIMPRINDL